MIVLFKIKYISTFFFCLFTIILKGQILYGCYSNSVNGVNVTYIRSLDFQNCTSEIKYELPNFLPSDLAIHPDGTFYIVGNSSAVFSIVNIDILSGATKSVNLPYNDIAGLVADIEGNLFLAGRNVIKFDPVNNQFTNYGPLPSDYYCAGDLTVNNGEYYITAYSDNLLKSAIIRLNLSDVSNSEVLFTDDIKYFLYSMASINESCGDVTTYGWGNDTNLYDINFNTGEINLVCSNEFYDFGGTSPSEFLASDPECDLLFDLDRDNSSGVFPYDFRNDAILCANDKSTHIVDTDVYLHTSAELDSIIIMLSGDLDGASESLTFNNNVANAALNFAIDKYILTLSGDRSDAAWITALRAIQYSNNSATPSAGLRTITFSAYNAIKSNQAQTFIRLRAQAYAGRDTSIVICVSTQIDGFSQRIGGQQGGYWSPPFATSDSYNSSIDLANTYHYIVQSSDCGLDTATVLIDRLPLRTLDLGPDISICRAESHAITIPTITGDEVLWSDGNTQANRILNTPGQYVVSITTSDGCVITDSIFITRSYAKIPKATTLDLCEGEWYTYKGNTYIAGDIIIDSLQANSGCDTLLNLTLRAIPAPNISRDTTTCDNIPITLDNNTYQIGDTISLLKNSPTGCDTVIQMVYRFYQSSIAGLLLQDTVVCKDLKTQAIIDASSFSGLIWSNGEQSLTSQFGAGNHFLQATDDRGCIRIIPFEIKSYPSIQYEIQATDPSCGQNNGSISIINNWPDLPFTTSMNGIITQNRENLLSGQYYITLNDVNGCETQDSLTLTNISDLDVTLPSEISGIIGQIISIAYQSSGGSIDTITFSPSSDINWAADSIAVAITGDRVYSITFIDVYGCTVTKTLIIDAEIPTSTLVLPNIVTLQSTDPQNALFYLKTEGITYDMSIYDRWGNLIHNAQKITGGDPTQAWQPSQSKVGPGVYVYLISVYTDDGVVHKYGTVTVL